ncbi:MAG: hypothetical protein KKC75_03630 [Nanoarchaeota archaeon]|nr:hypothetical protein [Nanoarchaeota archaeon]MBU1005111.1 hypothetical protein [Nanoarchaeota archaeon]MBU1946814.1 hypothetical protein [Nanoarchaeota archaeon]
MKIFIDLEKEDPEDLKVVGELINRRVPLDEELHPNQELEYDERLILAVIEGLAVKVGRTVPIQDIYEWAKKLNFTEKKIAGNIDSLKKRGEIFEVRTGFIQKI